jgi:hypothetical protein
MDKMPFDELHFKKVCLEIERHLIDTETSKLGHWQSARVYAAINRYVIGVPATVLSILLTWLLADGTKTAILFDVKLPVILSLLVSILSGLGAFLSLSDLSTRHRTAAENLHSLWRDCTNWETDYPDASACEKAVQTAQSYRSRLNEINKDSPQIPKWAWKSVVRQRAEGSVSYDLGRSASGKNS